LTLYKLFRPFGAAPEIFESSVNVNVNVNVHRKVYEFNLNPSKPLILIEWKKIIGC